MKKPLLIALFAAAALAPIGATQASSGVVVSVSTPEFGFRIGAPFYGPPAYAPVYAPPVYAPPVYMPSVYAPPVVVVPPPRWVYRPPVVVAPRVGYPVYVPRPRVVYPRVVEPRFAAPYVQQATYRIPPGHARHHKGHGHDD
jgi:hypothetical protein